MLISDFSTLTFDCYGTLIDWETGLANELQPLLAQTGGRFSREEMLLLYAKNERTVVAREPALLYSDLLAQTHRNIAQQLNIAIAEDAHQRFAASIAQWPAFADTCDALRYLKKHFACVILSNVDRIGFAASGKHLQIEFDAVFTAQDIGSYKPDKRNFEYMLRELQKKGIERAQILHVAQSQFHDLATAVQMGLATCWIDRRAGQPGAGATPAVKRNADTDFRFESLAQMAAAHKLELQSLPGRP